jgi:hypothetical protein
MMTVLVALAAYRLILEDGTNRPNDEAGRDPQEHGEPIPTKSMLIRHLSPTTR